MPLDDENNHKTHEEETKHESKTDEDSSEKKEEDSNESKDDEETNEKKETRDEFKESETKPGIHLYNPKTPVELHLPGGIHKFRDVFMEATFRKDMKSVSFEHWWSASMDMPLLELFTEQYKPGALNHTLDDYYLRRYMIPETTYDFKLGSTHQLQFHLDTDQGVPLFSVRIDGKNTMFEILDRFEDASNYDRFFIKGGLDVKVIRAIYEDPLPVPVCVPLSSDGILEGDRYEIKAKNPRNAKQLRLVFGDQSLDVPLNGGHEEIVLEVTGVERGRCTAKLNGVEIPGAISEGPFLTNRMILEGDLDFHWVTIVKPGEDEEGIESSKESKQKDEAEA
ncbi:uncharacterized protein LOC144096991 [Amblyomma americanum]